MFEQVSPHLKRFRMKFPVPGGEAVMRQDPCGMCGAVDAAKVSEIQYWDLADSQLVRCKSCGHMQLDPMLTGEVMTKGCLALYRHQQSGENSRSRRRGFFRAFRKGVAFGVTLRLMGIRPQRILEVGAGDAYFMIGLKYVFPDADCTCLDIVEEILEAIKTKHGFGTICSSLEKLSPEMLPQESSGGSHKKSDAKFDLIVARDILEHVEKPRQVIENLHSVLRPGGHLYFIVPNGWQDAWQSFSRWQVDRLKSELLINHVNYYDPESLKALLVELRFKIKKWYIYDLKTFSRGAGWRMIDRHKAAKSTARSADKVIASTESISSTMADAIKNPVPAVFSVSALRPLLMAYCWFKHTPLVRVRPEAYVGEEIFCLAEKT